MPNFIIKFINELPPGVLKAMGCLASLVTGFAAAFAVYYVLYRMGLPSKPFIYVAF